MSAVVLIIGLQHVRVLVRRFGAIFRPAAIMPVLHLAPGKARPFVDIRLVPGQNGRLFILGNARHAADLHLDVAGEGDAVRRRGIVQIGEEDDGLVGPALLHLGRQLADKSGDKLRRAAILPALRVIQLATVGAITTDVHIIRRHGDRVAADTHPVVILLLVVIEYTGNFRQVELQRPGVAVTQHAIVARTVGAHLKYLGILLADFRHQPPARRMHHQLIRPGVGAAQRGVQPVSDPEICRPARCRRAANYHACERPARR